MNLKIYSLAVFIIAVSTFNFFLKKDPPLVFKDNAVVFFTEQILKRCLQENFRRGCYDREIPKILEKGYLSMEDAFAVTNEIQKRDTAYLYCHTLGHQLADMETKKDVDKWLDVIARCPNSACNGGCAHGAVVRRFKGSETLTDSQIDTILPELKIACEPRSKWQPSGLEISLCYHSIGHLGMYITDADIDRSLELCRKITKKDDGRDYYRTCAQGVFMIIFQARDNDDVALVSKIVPKKEDVEKFCSRYNGENLVACRIESWPFFSDDLRSAQGLTKFCSFTNVPDFRKWCFDDSGMRGGLSIEILQSKGVEGVGVYCSSFPSDISGRCFGSVATAWVQDEPGALTNAVLLCNQADKYGYYNECFSSLASYGKFRLNFGSRDLSSYCNSLPTEFSGICQDKNYEGKW